MYYENDYEIEIPELEPVPTNDHFYIFKKLFVPLSSFTFWMQWLAIMALTIGLCFFGILFVQCGILILGMAANLTSMAIIITYSLQIFYQTADQDDMFEG